MSNRTLIQNNKDENINFYDLLFIVLNNFKLFIAIPIFVSIVTLIYLFFFTSPVYISSAKIMLSTSAGDFSQAQGLASQLGLSFGVQDNKSNWLNADIVKSKTLAKSLILDTYTTKTFGPKKSLKNILLGVKDNKNPTDNISEIKAINNFIKMIGFSYSAKSNIYTISISAVEPNFAKNILENLIKGIDKQRNDFNTANTKETRIFVEDRVGETETKLRVAEESLKVFRDRNRRIENSPALQLEQERLAREVSVLTSLFITLKQQLETVKIDEVKYSDYIIVVDPPNLPLIKSKPNKKKNIGFFIFP